MLDQLKNLANLPGLMNKAREMQDKMAAFQTTLAQKRYPADAGAGAVSAVVNGRMELISVNIDKTKIDTADTELLEDLIVSAVTAAQSKAAASIQHDMAKMTGDLGLPPGMIPGM
jgi:nucleoid-associated protein EbfC